jgi:hypothetical protein
MGSASAHREGRSIARAIGRRAEGNFTPVARATKSVSRENFFSAAMLRAP